MLPFLKEQVAEDSLVQNIPVSSEDKLAVDGKEKVPEQDFLTVAARGKSVRKSTIMLVVLFSIGLLCLWFMIKKSAPQAASAASAGTEETQIEQAISRLTGVRSEMFGRLDEVIKKLSKLSEVQQVKVNELLKNPFKLETFSGGLKRDSGISGDNLGIIRQQMSLRAADMQILSIMQSKQGNCCMIDDKVLYEGDLVRGFKIRQIGSNFVKLESDGSELILKLAE